MIYISFTLYVVVFVIEYSIDMIYIVDIILLLVMLGDGIHEIKESEIEVIVSC